MIEKKRTTQTEHHKKWKHRQENSKFPSFADSLHQAQLEQYQGLIKLDEKYACKAQPEDKLMTYTINTGYHILE